MKGDDHAEEEGHNCDVEDEDAAERVAQSIEHPVDVLENAE